MNFLKHMNTIMLIVAWASIVWADSYTHPHGIITDGTIGSKEIKALQGPNFHILAEHGEIKGNNLFHSFQTFNVHNNEQAIFYGPDNILNIVARVTGHEYSWIDGGIQSVMPEADIFFFNPNGVLFGPNVFLDVKGAFHVSTCDYIGFSDQSEYGTTEIPPLLTASSPVSFGFLDNDVGQIQIQGKGETIPSEYELLPSLYLKDDQTLSLIAGNIRINDGSYNMLIDYPVGTVVADNGRVNIASVASAGQVIFQTDGLNVSSFEKMGNITLSDYSVISSSSGQIFIYADHLEMNTSFINAGQYSNDDINVSGFAGGSIDIRVNQLSLLDGSGIIIETFSTENSGDINIHAENILIKGCCEELYSSISTSSISLDLVNNVAPNNEHEISTASDHHDGNAGNINIYTGNLVLSDGASIEANAFSRGNGGLIRINASDTIKIHGNLLDDCGIFAISLSDIENAGHAGDIQIQAKNLILQNGGKIINSTAGTGDAGMIGIHLDENLIIKGGDQNNNQEDPTEESVSGIFSTTHWSINNQGIAGDAGNIILSGKTFRMEQYSNLNVSSNSSGNAGKIYLEFETIELDKYAAILSVSKADGDSGYIFLQSGKLVSLNNYSMIGAQSLEKGKPGGIIINTPKISINNHSIVSSTSIHEDNSSDGLGVIIGQDIDLHEEEMDIEVHQTCEQIIIQSHSEISTESHGKGQAGVIYLMSKLIELDDHALISSSSMKKGDSGHSGDITLISDKISLNHASTITTENAGMGDAGTIRIFTADLYLDHFSKIHSVNTYGNDGGASGMVMVCRGIEIGLSKDLPNLIPANKISLNNHSGMSTSSLSEGGAGAIIIRINDLAISNYSFISAENKYPGFSNDIGLISIRSNNVMLSSQSKISTQNESESDAGGIAIETSELSLSGESFISSAGIHPDRKGTGGHIFIAKKISFIDDLIFGLIDIENKIELLDFFQIQEAVNTIHVNDSSYISTSSAGSGDAGGILIGSQIVCLSDHSSISSESTSAKGGGAAGSIKLDHLTYLSLRQDSRISTQAENTSVPDTIIPDFIENDRLNGMISISASEEIYLLDGSITSSVLGGLGNGGNISINSYYNILNKSQIIANAYEGNGGNIYITANHLVQSSDSIISASSQLGIDGHIVIEAFTENFEKQIVTLTENFLDGSKWIQTPCQSRDSENSSHFYLTLKKICPQSFLDWQPGRYK